MRTHTNVASEQRRVLAVLAFVELRSFTAWGAATGALLSRTRPFLR